MAADADSFHPIHITEETVNLSTLLQLEPGAENEVNKKGKHILVVNDIEANLLIARRFISRTAQIIVAHPPTTPDVTILFAGRIL